MPSKEFDDAIAQMRVFHETRKTFSGNGVLKHAPRLVKFSRDLDCKTGLDFGCGKGDAYDPNKPKAYGYDLRKELGYSPYLYDPAVPGLDRLPDDDMTFDLVWCVDVLECVPEGDMDFVIGQLAGYATKGLFVAVSSYPSKKQLPDGRNAHLTVQPDEWWMVKFAQVKEARPELHVRLLVA